MVTTSEWAERPLGEAAELLAGFPFKSEEFTDNSEDIRLLRGLNVANGRVHWEDCKRWHVNGSSALEPFLLCEGDIVLAMDGMIVGGETRVARIAKADVPSLLVQRVARLRARERFDQGFLYFLLSTDNFRDYLWGMQTGTTISHVSGSQIQGFRVRFPPLPEQRAIARVLGSLDDKIELNRRMNQTLEEICRALFKFWFVDFGPVRAKAEGRWKKGESLPGMPADMWDLWPSEFEESEIGDVPKGWGVGGLGKVASCRRDIVDPSEIDPQERYVGLEHITPMSLSLWRWGRVGDTVSGKARFKRGEILFGKLRPYFHKVSVPWFDGVASTDILTIAPKSPDWFGFALGHFSSTALVDYATAASNGTKMPRTSWEDLARWQVAMPPVELGRSLSAVFRPLVSKMGKAIEESTVLGETRDALLPKLLSGEIRVKVDA